MATSYLYVDELNHDTPLCGGELSQAAGVTVGIRQSQEQEWTGDIESDESRKDSGSGESVRPTPQKSLKDAVGLYVYFIQCDGPLQAIKIGYARSPETRLSNLQSGCPYQLRLIGHAPVDDAEGIEAQLHEKFRALSLRGEWHASTPELLDLAARADQYRHDRFQALFEPDVQPALPVELQPDRRMYEGGFPSDPVPESIRAELDRLRDRYREAHRLAVEKRNAEHDKAFRIEYPQLHAQIEEETRKPANDPPKPRNGQFIWRGRVRNS